MTRATLRGVVQKALGNRTDVDSFINSGLDLAVGEMCKRHAFKAQWVAFGPLTIVANDLSVALPVGTLHLIEARLLLGGTLLGKRMTIKNKGWVTQRMPSVSQIPPAQPWLGYYEGGVLYFGPPAEQTYTLVGTIVQSPQAYASDATENPIPLSDLTQMAFATAFVKRLLNQPDQAQVWDTEFEKRLASDVKNDMDRKANDLSMDEFSPRAQQDGYEDGGSQPWLDPFYDGRGRTGRNTY